VAKLETCSLAISPGYLFISTDAIYYSVSKLLSLLIFLFIFDNSSHLKNLKFYHRFCYNLFY
jgi:hypothetical protein